MKIDNIDLEIFCKHFNNIVSEAIEHGGDYGGPYYINQKNLENSINIFLKWLGLNKYLTLYKDDIPKILIKNKVDYNKED